MAKVTINVPRHKLPSFLQLTRKLRIHKDVVYTDGAASSLFPGINMKQIKKNISPFALFDWEFFSNELEFE